MKSFFKSFNSKNISFDTTIVTLIGFSGLLVIGEAYERTSLSDAQTATDCQYPPVSEILTSYHVRALEENNIVVIHNVLSPSQLEGARLSAQKLSATMARLNHSNDNSIRQDEICLVREDRSTEIGDDMIHCIKLLRGLPFILSLLHYTVSSSFVIPRQCQLAKYKPDGSTYVRHLDRCTSTLLDMGLMEWLRASDYRHRTLTAILYLNSPEWTDGGNLRCFGEDGSKIDINPTGGTLVIFDSSRVEHQVLPSSMDRFALTLWINGVMSS
mmetsp:Transcript_6408/g.12085  ORF Transcript_6408/g.12085 Transcript_6408/m.12085 type:complete len:270 (-) Transcript_6408:996-1805(-)